MIRNFQELPFDYIAWSDTRFKLTFRHVPPMLRLSVKEVGVLNPIIVTESDDPERYIIVTGWLRFQAARDSGETSIPSHIYVNVPHKILLLCGLFDNVGHRVPNAVEQAITLKKLLSFYSREELVSNLLPLVGFPRESEDWERVLPLCDASEEIQLGIADAKLSEAAALTLLKFPAGEAEPLFRMMRRLGIRPTSQNLFVGIFAELWARDQLLPTSVMAEEDWLPLGKPFEPRPEPPLPTTQTRRTGNHNLGHNVLAPGGVVKSDNETPQIVESAERSMKWTAEQIINRLNQRRNPHASKLHEKIDADMRGLQLPPEASLYLAENGELHRQKLEIHFDSPSQLKRTLMKVLDAEERGLFKRLFTDLRRCH